MKNILVAVSGLTPQIITEAVFCLKKRRKITIDEIYIITTERGRKVIQGSEKGSSEGPLSLKSEIISLAKKLKIDEPFFEAREPWLNVAAEESVELPDIRNDKDNVLFPNKVCSIIRDLSAGPENILHCVISGGRKSMSVHLALAMTLFGRENDKLWHVLTSEQFEFKDYFPKSKRQEESLELSEIPFVRLRSFLSETPERRNILNSSYNDIVSFTQQQLRIAGDSRKLILRISNRRLEYDNQSVDLPLTEFLLFHFFAERNMLKTGKISITEILEKNTSEKLLDFSKENYPGHYFEPGKKKAWWVDGFSKTRFRELRSKINKKIQELIPDVELQRLFIIDSEKLYRDSKYFIRSPKDKLLIIENE
jgi:CRISPR-associated protein (TIGR02584 family)